MGAGHGKGVSPAGGAQDMAASMAIARSARGLALAKPLPTVWATVWAVVSAVVWAMSALFGAMSPAAAASPVPLASVPIATAQVAPVQVAPVQVAPVPVAGVPMAGPAAGAHQRAGAEGGRGEILLAQGRSSNFFDRLFGGNIFRGAPRRRPDARSGPRFLVPPQDLPQNSAAARPETMPKDPEVRTVFVFGDAFASGLANALQSAFSTTPTIEIVKRPKLGSGLVRYDYYDWEAALAETLAIEKVDIAVIMMGSNDRQAFRDQAEGEVEWRSQKWEDLYIARVDALLRQFSDRGIPVYWVGLPIMRAATYGQDMAFLNTVYLARTQRAGGKFIDVWSRFADEEGRYSDAGPDVNGKIRRLRDANGIHLTGTGYKKLAFFVETELRADLDSGQLLSNVPNLGAPEGGIRRFGPVEMEVSLTKPEVPQGVVTLAGGGGAAPAALSAEENPSPDYRLLVLGESPAPKPGRADDFAWPRPSAAARPAPVRQP